MYTGANPPTFKHCIYRLDFTPTCNKEISVEFACDTTADVICVFSVGGEVGGVWDIPNTTAVVIWPSEDLVAIWSEVCYMYSPDKKYSETKSNQFTLTNRSSL